MSVGTAVDGPCVGRASVAAALRSPGYRGRGDAGEFVGVETGELAGTKVGDGSWRWGCSGVITIDQCRAGLG